jgi:virginiamycin A acetyltransferase
MPEKTESLNNFLWDLFLRSFEGKDALYEDSSVLNDSEKCKLIKSYLKNIDIWTRIYDERVSFIKTNVHLIGRKQILDAKEVYFHPKFGWIVVNGVFKAFLGKVSFNLGVKVNIGNRTHFSGYGIVRGKDLLQIGSYSCIAEGCYINVFRDSHPMDYPSLYGFNKENPRMSYDKMDLPVKYTKFFNTGKMGVTIGNDVWIGRNVRIFNGVSIADGCVIAEMGLVKRNCEPYGIYGGIPAKLIRYRFSKDVIEQLLEIQWWNWPFSKIKRNLKFFDTDLTNFDGRLSSIIVDDE